ncbi:MAG: bifunctional metallophosphatase/5'-nucleotidase [Myxococcota bacterium]
MTGLHLEHRKRAFEPLSLIWVAITACGTSLPPVTLIPDPPDAAVSFTPEQTDGLSIVVSTDLNGQLVGDDPLREGLLGWSGRVDRVPEPKLLLDNGDAWNGGSVSNVLQGRPVREVFELMGVQAVNLGNHEFDRGQDDLRSLESRFRLLSCNLRMGGRSPDYAEPFVVLHEAGFKVGVVGLQSETLPQRTRVRHTEGLTVLPAEQVLKSCVSDARGAGAEVVVVLYHEDPAKVRRFMLKVDLAGVDLVVASDRQPGFHTRIKGIAMVQPGGLGRSVAVARFVRDPRGVRLNRLWLEDGRYDPPPEVARVILHAQREAARVLDASVGTAPTNLAVGDFHQSPLGQFTAQAWLAAVPDADVALLNHGALRHPLIQGPVSEAQLRDALPFDDELVLVTLTGAQLREALTKAPVAGGFRWSYTVDQKGIRPLSVVHQDGYSVEEDRSLQVLMPEFLAEGGDDFPLEQYPRRPTGVRMRAPVREALASQAPLNRNTLAPRATFVSRAHARSRPR